VTFRINGKGERFAQKKRTESGWGSGNGTTEINVTFLPWVKSFAKGGIQTVVKRGGGEAIKTKKTKKK